VESFNLKLHNISKYDASKYECVANNGILPSVSKMFTINVKYKPIVIPTRPNVYQYNKQTVLLGCVVNSNPESTITWYKEDVVEKKGDDLLKPLLNEKQFVKVNTADINDNNNKIQILKYKQTNKTVSYYKINKISNDDFGRYKCEAENSVGKGESIIELLEMKQKQKNIFNNADSIAGSGDDTIDNFLSSEQSFYDDNYQYYDNDDEMTLNNIFKNKNKNNNETHQALSSLNNRRIGNFFCSILFNF
jgi:hypothetical protein